MKSVKRYYADLKPSNYKLDLTPDANNLAFTGSVAITLKKTARPSQRLTFHQHGLKVSSATITKHDKKGDRALPVVRINNQDTLDEVRLHTDEMVYSGEYTVNMQFSGVITKGMTGLYPCYFKVDGKEHVMLATQFESHHARELFPCIDEPEAKATFDLTLHTPNGLAVLANTPVSNQEDQANGLVATTFETTPKMSTYLLAFVIGELQSKSTQTKRGTEVSVWATIAQPLDALDFALEAAKGSIEYYEDYFDVQYPLAKCDHVGLPDFTVGAMENWGLITYRERLLLAYPGQASQSIKEYIAMVIAHETSHQWFGNLVTMRWWDDLWLNESFANMMEFQAVDHMFPDWHIWETFIMGEGLVALRRDATPGVQAVKTNVRHPMEINTLFDHAIVYAKGGRLLYMLKTYLGEDAFRKGLTEYFNKHKYGNASGADLWEALGKASGVDVASFMDPWLERSGFPVVTVKPDGDGKFELSQAHFLESGALSDGRLWPVPLFANDPAVPARLDKASVHVAANAKPLVINEHSAGHYIVNYADQSHMAQIIKLVANQKLGATERLMLLNNASMLSKSGLQQFGNVLRLLDAYQSEHAEPVWEIIALTISEARRFIDWDESIEPAIKRFVRELTAGELTRLGWKELPNESAADSKLRATIIGLNSYAETPSVVGEAIRQFKAHVSDSLDIAPELRSIVFGSAIREGIPGAVDYLLNLHDTTPNSDLKADAMSALTSTKNPDDASHLLERLKNASLVKPQDADYWIFYLLRNRHTRETAWQWMVVEWPWVVETYAHDKSYDDFPRYAAGICNTKAWQQKYTDFFAPKRDELELERNINIAMSEIDTRVKWLARDLASVQQFFKSA